MNDPDGPPIGHLRAKHRSLAVQHKHPVNVAHYQQATFAQRLADRTANTIGSWPFLIGQSLFMAAWIVVNAVGVLALHWDPYPFIFLNLLLSFQATYAGPVLLLAANRHAQKDRLTLEHAAHEAHEGGERIRKILIQIKENTDLTNQILSELEAADAAPQGSRS